MALSINISPVTVMTRSSHLLQSNRLSLAMLLLTVVGVVHGIRDLTQDVIISQPEPSRLSPVRLTSLWSSRQQPPRLVGVVEPGRLLNIFLGIILVMGFAVLNSYLFIALGISGALPPRFAARPRGRPPRGGNVGMPQFSQQVFNALDENRFTIE